MITPRATRLVRVASLHEFRRVIARLASADLAAAAPAAIIVPTRGAASVLLDTLGRLGCSMWAGAADEPLVLTRDRFYDALHARIADPPRALTSFERDAMAQAAAARAAAGIDDLPFRVRPGLVAELLRFYDQLRRQSRQLQRFEELIAESLGGDTDDRGAARMLQQTEFLVRAFRYYEELVAGSDAVDEHGLRDRLLGDPSLDMFRHVIVTVPDWIADPDGLCVADFDFLARVPRLERLDIVSTSAVLGSGFHERLHNWWPGLEEVDAVDLDHDAVRVRPMLVRPSAEDDCLWFVRRDREDELAAIASRLSAASDASTDWQRIAVVFKRPLPYLYLAPLTLGAAGIPYYLLDELPLAAEPVVATVDLVLDAVESGFSRESLIALLRSVHLDLSGDGTTVTAASVRALNVAFSEERYLGELARLEAFKLPKEYSELAAPALCAAVAVARDLAALSGPASASQLLGQIRTFITAHLRPIDDTTALGTRERDASQLVDVLLDRLAEAHSRHHDPEWTIADLAAAIRRWIGDHTFPAESTDRSGVRLLDDQAARYGDFDDISIIGLIEQDWPAAARRNIFYSPVLLKALGWPSEHERRSAADARFVDLLASAASRVQLSTFTLDDEAIVARSVQLDEVPVAKLSTIVDADTARPPLQRESIAAASPAWAALRAARPPSTEARFHGTTGPLDAARGAVSESRTARERRPWSVSALETYIGCPFRFFAQHVLGLEEEPDDEEVMDPRTQGQFVHDVFERFFKEWQTDGHGAITAATLHLARHRFAGVVEALLVSLPEGERALERTRLLGSSAAAGLGEAVFRMEAERPVPVVERLLEHKLEGEFSIQTAEGTRAIRLRGKADRVDLLADGTFRLIDYKLGWPPDKGRALQLPIYGICAEQRLAAHRGRQWSLSEAVYLAFKGPKRVVPLFTTDANRAEALANAQQRLADTIDAIERGDFPPSPDDVYRCETCTFAAVCRKDYVGDV